jgi:hypothetical protein
MNICFYLNDLYFFIDVPKKKMYASVKNMEPRATDKKSKDVFEKKPKVPKKAKAMPKKGEDGLFEETKGTIKEGGLRKALKVGADYKFTRPKLMKLLKVEEGKSFEFEGKTHKMTEKLRKQIQLAVNMMK